MLLSCYYVSLYVSYICMYLCMHLRVYVCMYVCKVCMFGFMHNRNYVCISSMQESVYASVPFPNSKLLYYASAPKYYLISGQT